MLVPRLAASVRRTRVIASIVLIAIVAALAGIAVVVANWPSAWVWVGASLTTLGLSPFAFGAIAAMRVDVVTLVFDRRVTKPDELPYAESQRLEARLTHSGHEIDAQLTALGLEPLATYLELRLGLGIARHDPSIACRNITRLLELRGPSFDDETRAALTRLARNLESAAQQGARFCMVPLGGWSGLIETNLRLYFGGF